jgi:hypothetical protein
MVVASEMTLETAAAALHGNQYASEGSKQLWVDMKAAGLIAVFGASDDLTEFRGAIDDETGAGDGTEHFLTRKGVLQSQCDEGEDCPYFREKLEATPVAVTAHFDEEGYTWFLETALLHTTFDIMEDDETYCRGLVIRLEDLPA